MEVSLLSYILPFCLFRYLNPNEEDMLASGVSVSALAGFERGGKDFSIYFVAAYGLRAEQVISNSSRTLERKILKPFLPQQFTQRTWGQTAFEDCLSLW